MTEKVSVPLVFAGAGFGVILGVIAVGLLNAPTQPPMSEPTPDVTEPSADVEYVAAPSESKPMIEHDKRLNAFFSALDLLEQRNGGVSLQDMNLLAEIHGIKRYGDLNRPAFEKVVNAVSEDSGISVGQLNYLANIFGLPGRYTGNSHPQFGTLRSVQPNPADDVPAYEGASRAYRAADIMTRADGQMRTSSNRASSDLQRFATGGTLASEASDTSLSDSRSGIVNPSSGEFYAPSGSGYVSTRDGRYYSPAGPNGVIDTQTGRYIPTAP